jgi:hypothetical protein
LRAVSDDNLVDSAMVRNLEIADIKFSESTVRDMSRILYLDLEISE